MPTVQRLIQRGAARGRRALSSLGEDFRQKRLAVGLSQQHVASAVGIGRATYTRIEAGSYEALSIAIASRIAAVLGLDLTIRAYPGASPLRDGAHWARLGLVLDTVARPLRAAREVALPTTNDRPYEQRAWDAMVSGLGRRTAMEMEMRLTDAQELERRINSKRRDDPVDSFVLLVADTNHNRRALREFPAVFADLERLTFRALCACLAAGRHPPSALVLVPSAAAVVRRAAASA